MVGIGSNCRGTYNGGVVRAQGVRVKMFGANRWCGS